MRVTTGCRPSRTSCTSTGGAPPSARPCTWPLFHAAYQRIVRCILLGDAATDDERSTELRDRLRADGNWFMLHRRHHALRRELFARTQQYIDRAGPGGGLARAIVETPRTADHTSLRFTAAPRPAG
ncbi:hypothetical protein GCM10010218_60590 [Streptomyces mashuensis]|uniref:Uncharacterized protein n=1 Tax=Streptomyces mashuensis TaxID=33904 RepID=A0A919B997_9ACTN|nr:hypothetical protein [Streptomyces mashuensis]GHF71136.1 hypothetical protein GCM10010218_60590 [Streptomyces mashuensis]